MNSIRFPYKRTEGLKEQDDMDHDTQEGSQGSEDSHFILIKTASHSISNLIHDCLTSQCSLYIAANRLRSSEEMAPGEQEEKIDRKWNIMSTISKTANQLLVVQMKGSIKSL